jgi:hypothetical protein
MMEAPPMLRSTPPLPQLSQHSLQQSPGFRHFNSPRLTAGGQARRAGAPKKCDELLPQAGQLELWRSARDIQDVSGPLPDEGAN